MINFLAKEEVISAHYFIMNRMNDADQAGVKDHGAIIYCPRYGDNKRRRLQDHPQIAGSGPDSENPVTGQPERNLFSVNPLGAE